MYMLEGSLFFSSYHSNFKTRQNKENKGKETSDNPDSGGRMQ
jgi:hypothetical protein